MSIFQECQPEFLHDLVLKMRASIFTPGDMICRRGEVAREMFIIADGVLEVIRFQHFCSFNVCGTGEPQSPLGGTLCHSFIIYLNLNVSELIIREVDDGNLWPHRRSVDSATLTFQDVRNDAFAALGVDGI